jgi:beta-aspartyl-peptidase (threonine type)
MILVGSTNAQVGFAEAMKILRSGGSALDAVEVCIRAVESNPNDHSVGLGGLPNILGVVELDASLMDGRTLAAGAVAAVKGYEHPITIARQVMERLPHVLLVGEGAEQFADDIGEAQVNLLTDEAKAIYEGKLRDNAHPMVLAQNQRLRELVEKIAQQAETAAEKFHGTVDVMALDARGNIASGVSTSGWAWKYPGRVGDSPIIGAGNYADNRYGACACTGYGEMAIRCSTARSVIVYMKTGMSLEDAAREAMWDLKVLTLPFEGRMNLIALDRHGNHVGMTDQTHGQATYVFQTVEMTEPEVQARLIVTIGAS